MLGICPVPGAGNLLRTYFDACVTYEIFIVLIQGLVSSLLGKMVILTLPSKTESNKNLLFTSFSVRISQHGQIA